MLERVTETREIVFDLYLWFFSGEEEELQGVQSRLDFTLDPELTFPRPTPGTFSVDFDSDYASDKPGWVYRVSDIPDGSTLWTFGGEKTWQSSPDVRKSFEDNPLLSEWVFFSRLSAAVEVSYEWDFEDEAGMEDFSDSVGKPVFESLTLNPEIIQLSEYVIQSYDY